MAAKGVRTFGRFDFFGTVGATTTVLSVVLSDFFFETLPLALMRVMLAAPDFFVATFDLLQFPIKKVCFKANCQLSL